MISISYVALCRSISMRITSMFAILVVLSSSAAIAQMTYPSVEEAMEADEYPLFASETWSRCIGLMYAQLDWASTSVPENAQSILRTRLESALCYSEFARTRDVIAELTERAGIFAYLYGNHFARNFADTGSAFPTGSLVQSDLGFCSSLLQHEDLPEPGFLWLGCE